MNFEKARNTMVENQLKPNKITTSKILSIFLETEKERFLGDEVKGIAYSDVDIKIVSNRGYLKNLQIAQLIEHSNVNQEDKILHIGALTGYVSSILSKLSNKVIAIESDNFLIEQLNNNIKEFQLTNINMHKADLRKGFEDQSPYNLIFIDNPLTNIPNIILNQLSPDLGRLIMIEKINEELGKAVRITKNNKNFNKEILFDVFSKFELFKNEKRFIF